MDPVSIEELIRQYIQLPTVPSGTGWFPVLCKSCNDHGRKGPRAAFKFEEGTAAYHCFNCGLKSTYNPDTYDHLPNKMKKVFEAFNIPTDEINALKLGSMKRRDEKGSATTSSKESTQRSINPKEIKLPDHFYRLDEAEPSDKWAEVAQFYLEDRKINPTEYTFYLSTGVPKKIDGPDSMKHVFVKQAQKWKARIIIPIYKDGKLIFYQGRDLSDKALKKYESPSTPKDRVLYGFDQLFSDNPAPLYVCEGFFDAFPINGVAVLGNQVTDAQAAWLNKSNRDKVYIPDKYGTGAKNAERAKNLGWKISLPDVGNCKDISDAFVKYGKIYVHNTLREHTMDGFQAEAALNLYCKK